jgi:hypothetical protein
MAIDSYLLPNCCNKYGNTPHNLGAYLYLPLFYGKLTIRVHYTTN